MVRKYRMEQEELGPNRGPCRVRRMRAPHGDVPLATATLVATALAAPVGTAATATAAAANLAHWLR